MPLFNEMFVFLFFHAFQRSNNMYLYLGIREGQSYILSLSASGFQMPTAQFSTTT
jgi:hypothetical protein